MDTEIGLKITVENFGKIIDELNNMFILPVTEDITDKSFSCFINGMSRTKDGTHICDIFGNIYEVQGKVIDDFSCGRAVARYGEEYGFIDEKGQSIDVKASIVKHYADNLAPIKMLDEDYRYYGKWCYVDLDGKRVSPQVYATASPFKDGCALVYNLDHNWECIDDKFNVVSRFGNNWRDIKRAKHAYNSLNKDRSCFIEDPIEIMYHQEDGYFISMMDKRTGLNPLIDKFAGEMANKYNVSIIGKNSKERLLCLINALSQIGNFIIPYGVLDIIPANQAVETEKNVRRIRIISERVKK